MIEEPLLTPPWIQDVLSLLSVKSQFLLTGNVRDRYFTVSQGMVTTTELSNRLSQVLTSRGYTALLVHDPVHGLQIHPQTEATHALLRDLHPAEGRLNLPQLLEVARQVVNGDIQGHKHRLALLLDDASRMVEDLQNLSEEQHHFYLTLEKLSRQARVISTTGAVAAHNPIFWVLSSERDLPDWYVVGNDLLRVQHIPLPDFEERLMAARRFLRDNLESFEDLAEAQQTEVARTFARHTDGMTLRSMDAISFLADQNGIPATEIADAVRVFRVGVLENPWKKDHIRERIHGAETQLRNRVKGQHAAITQTLDILKRSVMGLSGAQSSSTTSRPRGVLFFAGPTGVGKTELVKALTQILFDDEQAYIRFDMSEFSAEHADQRLMGAPPGYVGYDAGGELTNAIRQKPFSVVLFDEIEKAHPRILDKFLQVLEDGRLTDGRGNTVYFSEAVIVFTSNLGMYTENPHTHKRELNVQMDASHTEVKERVLDAIRHHFKFELGRPEILNRIGDNIVVFDFIRPEVAKDILRMMLGNIQKRVQQEHHLQLRISDTVWEDLLQRCLQNLENGGRGIGNLLETVFINPLSRALFDLPAGARTQITVQALREQDGVHQVELG